jgi:beta-lactamase class A
MYPTPRSCDLEGGVVKNVELNKGSFSRKNKKGVRYGVKLKDAVHYLEKQKLLPTPTTQDAKNNANPSQMKRKIKPLNAVIGGRLNPNFVEYLMGFPTDWTRIEQTGSKDSETQSCRKSHSTSDKP